MNLNNVIGIYEDMEITVGDMELLKLLKPVIVYINDTNVGKQQQDNWDKRMEYFNGTELWSYDDNYGWRSKLVNE